MSSRAHNRWSASTFHIFDELVGTTDRKCHGWFEKSSENKITKSVKAILRCVFISLGINDLTWRQKGLHGRVHPWSCCLCGVQYWQSDRLFPWPPCRSIVWHPVTGTHPWIASRQRPWSRDCLGAQLAHTHENASRYCRRTSWRGPCHWKRGFVAPIHRQRKLQYVSWQGHFTSHFQPFCRARWGLFRLNHGNFSYRDVKGCSYVHSNRFIYF